MNAIIFAAGLGTRLKPLTDTMPKALVPLKGKPMLEHIILRLKAAGFTHIVINIHHWGEQIVAFLERNHNFGIRIDVSDERDLLLDTGGGIKKAAAFFTDKRPFLVHNVDVLTDLDLNAFYHIHDEKKSLATLLVASRETQRYLLFDSALRLYGWKNEKTGEVKSPYPDFLPDLYHKYAFGGIHVLSHDILPLMKEWEGKFSIIDFYLSIADQKQVCAYPAPQGLVWCDIGKPEALKEAERLLEL